MRRYDNKRKIVRELLDKLLDVPNQTSESGTALRNMHDTGNECLMAIQNLNVDTKNWDSLVVHILMEKLNKSTILDYEGRLGDVRELKSLESFLEYIESRLKALISAERSKEKVSEKIKSEKEQNKNEKLPFSCTFCEKNHSIYKCDDFKQWNRPKEMSGKKEKNHVFCSYKCITEENAKAPSCAKSAETAKSAKSANYGRNMRFVDYTNVNSNEKRKKNEKCEA